MASRSGDQRTKENRPRRGEVLYFSPTSGSGEVYALKEGRSLAFSLKTSPELNAGLIRPGTPVTYLPQSAEDGKPRAVEVRLDEAGSLEVRLRAARKGRVPITPTPSRGPRGEGDRGGRRDERGGSRSSEPATRPARGEEGAPEPKAADASEAAETGVSTAEEAPPGIAVAEAEAAAPEAEAAAPEAEAAAPEAEAAAPEAEAAAPEAEAAAPEAEATASDSPEAAPEA